MEVIENFEVTGQCFKSKHRLLDNLSIVFNEANSMFIFWNKYQIFVYEDLNFESASKIIIPEFIVSQVLVSNNYLMCLDSSGNVQITSLKFKNAAQKRFKSSFQPREHGILLSTQYNQDNILSLKYDSDTFYLYLNKISVEFSLDKKVSLKLNRSQWKPHTMEGKCVLRSCAISKEDYELVKRLFKTEQKEWNEHSIIIISPDKYTIYGCLFSQKETDEEIELIKLYATPSEICDIKITEMNILIGIKTGTVIKLHLKDNEPPNIVHINTGISKFIAFKANDTLIYTDGSTMWKAEETFSNNIKFSQFFIKQIKDFAKYGDHIVCTTYSNLYYTFSLDDDRSYLNVEMEDKYFPAEIFLTNSDCYYKLLEEIDNNNYMLEKINEEGNYLTALSLSRRQEIMDTIIDLNVVIYENYEDVKKETEILLTEELYEYFKESFLFLIKLTASIIQQNYSNILSNLLEDIKIHITLLSEKKVLKTTSLQLSETLKNIQVLMPLETKNMVNTSQIKVDIKIVTNIPGVYKEENKICVLLYRKQMVFNSEQFIKTTTSTMRHKNLSLNEPEGTIDDLLQKVASNHHGHLFHIMDTSKNKTNDHLMYVKLPNNFKEIFNNEQYFLEHFNSSRASFLQNQLTSEEFLKSNSNLTFEILNEKVKIEIINDFSCLLLKVSCSNMKIAFNVRNFFAKLIYNDFMNCPTQEHVNYVFYATTENLQKAVKKSMVEGCEEISSLADLFHMSIIGALPL